MTNPDPDPPQHPTPQEPTDRFSAAAVADFLELLARQIAQLHQHNMAAKGIIRPTGPDFPPASSEKRLTT